jgi:hypothetical protein
MYCVYFTIYKGDRLPPFYIGSAPVSKINCGYHGSASSAQWGQIWKSELKDNPHLFVTFIIPDQYAPTPREILDLELKWQKLFNVVEDPSFVNQAYAKAGFCSSPESARKAVETRKRNGRTARTEETRRKISEANRGRKLPPITEETRQKQSAARKGKSRSKEWRDKISASNTGKKHSEETRAKLRLVNRRPQTLESIAKRLTTIEANGGYNHSEETKRKIGEANRGKVRAPVSDETRKKLSERLTGNKRSPEAMAKYRETIARKQAERAERQSLGLPVQRTAAFGKPKSPEAIGKRVESRARNKKEAGTERPL